MKTIRYLATLLLLAAGVGHIVLFLQEPMTMRSAVVLAFGIIYIAIGILLFLNIKYSYLLGIILPLSGMIVGVTAFDPNEIPPLLGILGIVDALIVVLCSILEWHRRKRTVI